MECTPHKLLTRPQPARKDLHLVRNIPLRHPQVGLMEMLMGSGLVWQVGGETRRNQEILRRAIEVERPGLTELQG